MDVNQLLKCALKSETLMITTKNPLNTNDAVVDGDV